MSYAKDVDYVIHQKFDVKVRRFQCKFCVTITPMPDKLDMQDIDVKKLAQESMQGTVFITPMEHYYPEGWMMYANDLMDCDSMVCPKCAAKIDKLFFQGEK